MKIEEIMMNSFFLSGREDFHYEKIDDARKEFYDLAEKGDASAQYSLFYCYLRPWGGLPERTDIAMDWLIKAANGGNLKAMYNLAGEYEAGTHGLTKNYQKAYEWYCKAAEKGSAYAYYKLSEMYENGLFVSKNISKMVEYRIKAAELGDDIAIHQLYTDYRDGNGVSPNINTAVDWLRKGAELGSNVCRVLYVLNSKIGNGPGITKSLAVKYIKAASYEQNPLAQVELASMYSEGSFLERNLELALFWYYSNPSNDYGAKEEYKELLTAIKRPSIFTTQMESNCYPECSVIRDRIFALAKEKVLLELHYYSENALQNKTMQRLKLADLNYIQTIELLDKKIEIEETELRNKLINGALQCRRFVGGYYEAMMD